MCMGYFASLQREMFPNWQCRPRKLPSPRCPCCQCLDPWQWKHFQMSPASSGYFSCLSRWPCRFIANSVLYLGTSWYALKSLSGHLAPAVWHTSRSLPLVLNHHLHASKAHSTYRSPEFLRIWKCFWNSLPRRVRTRLRRAGRGGASSVAHCFITVDFICYIYKNDNCTMRPFVHNG